MTRIRKCIILVIMAFLLVKTSLGLNADTKWPELKGPYLGQKPPGITPEIFAPGIISTEEKNELNSVFSLKGDEFFYAIYTPKPVNKCTIMYSKQVNDIWTKPEVAHFSGKYIDVDMAFSLDGNKLYFCSIRPDSSRSNREAKHDIWYCNRLKNNNWSEPIKMGPLINSNASETYPCFTQNGRMYFASTRKGGKGSSDIYFSQQIDGKFSEPINMGSAINTQYGEGDAFVAPDESFLIVSSRERPDCIGQKDFYISFKKKNGSWTIAKNMGKQINTKVYEYCPMVSPDGKYLFFSRYSEGKSDIYWVDAKIIENLKPKELK